MKSCSSAVCVLVLLITTGSESSFTSVTVELHDPATLPCAGRCSGVVRWTALQKPTEVLAECDQTSCRSGKEGYQMNRDQYLKGNFSLIITKAEFNIKTWFTSKCDDDDICEVDIQTYRPVFCSTTVTVKLHDPATLQCTAKCPGVASWTVHNSTDVLAECDQTSCRSVKEGYQMIRDQYLKRNYSLIITKAEFSTKTRYTCKCDNGDLCDVDVQTYRPEFCSTTVTVKLHDSATLHCIGTCSGVAKWTVYQNSTDVKAECDQMSCRSVKGYQMNHDQYPKGNFSLTITKAEFNTSTWFTCWCDDRDLCEVDVQTYHDPTDSGAVLPVWGTVLVVVLSLFVIMALVVIVALMVILRRRREHQRPLINDRNSVEMNEHSDHSPETDGLSNPNNN